MIQLVRQDGYPDCCVHACIAMIAGTTLAEIIRRVGHSERMGIAERNKLLDDLGFKRSIGEHGGEFAACGWNNPPELTGISLCSVYSFLDPQYAHAVVIADGTLYDPQHGINPGWPWHRRIMSYVKLERG